MFNFILLVYTYFFFFCSTKINIIFSGFFSWFNNLNVFAKNKWSHYCRRFILSFNGTRRGRKGREIINNIITFWLYPGWLIFFDYLRLIYYTNWNLVRISNCFFFALTINIANIEQQVSYKNRCFTCNVKQNYDRWDIYLSRLWSV